MSPENTPTNSSQSVDSEYSQAVQKQNIQADILNMGDKVDQSRVDAIMGHAAFEASVQDYAPKETPLSEASAEAPVLTQAGADILTDLTIPADQEDNDALVTEAARRQVSLDFLYAKQDLQERAARESWSEDKYANELATLEAKS